MEDITDVIYAHAKTVCKTIEIQNLGEYHDLHIQSNTLLLADVFERFDLFPAPGLAWQAAFKKTKVKLDLLTYVHILLMVEKSIRWEICHSIYQCAKANNKYIKDYDKNKELPYLRH